MSVDLPSIEIEEFSSRLLEVVGRDLSNPVLERLWLHYRELRRWSRGLSLVGPGTAKDVVARHYGESLLALPLLESSIRLADLGSGAGFPGWVLAAAAPHLDVWLVESRHRKALFLEAAARRAALSLTVLNARVGRSLPKDFPDSLDLLTIRAMRLPLEESSALERSLARTGRVLRWVGPAAPEPPGGWVVGREIEVAGSGRRVEELVREGVEPD